MTENKALKIAVLGAGSLGCALGARLALGGSQVILVNHRQAQVDALKAHGLTLHEAGQTWRVPVQAAIDCSALGPVDLVIVLVKSFDTRAAIQGAAPLLGPDTVVLSLQNGLGHEDVLADAVGRERLLAGKTYVGGVLTAPGVVAAGTMGKATFVGEPYASEGAALSPRALRIAQVFNAAGLATTVSPNIMGTIWDKLLVNVATGALSGITRLPYGKLYAVPEVEACAVAAVQEAMAVARAQGVRLGITDPLEAWRVAGRGLSDDFRASMLQSLDKGSITEVDYINGAVVALGARLGVPTPVNRTLVACIKGIEKGLPA